MHCMYGGVPKGQAEAAPNNEKIKPVSLAIAKLHLSESINQSVSRKLHFFLNSVELFDSIYVGSI